MISTPEREIKERIDIMVKNITRTITRYKHTIGKISKGENGFQMDDIREFTAEKKLGDRQIKKYYKENGLEGYSLISVEEVYEKYALPIEVFMKYAVKI